MVGGFTPPGGGWLRMKKYHSTFKCCHQGVLEVVGMKKKEMAGKGSP